MSFLDGPVEAGCVMWEKGILSTVFPMGPQKCTFEKPVLHVAFWFVFLLCPKLVGALVPTEDDAGLPSQHPVV